VARRCRIPQCYCLPNRLHASSLLTKQASWCKLRSITASEGASYGQRTAYCGGGDRTLEAVALHKPTDSSPSEPQAPANAPPTVSVPPLNVTALVVTKADLVNALRIYVPQLMDVAPLDGNRFLLGLTPSSPESEEEGARD